MCIRVIDRHMSVFVCVCVCVCVCVPDTDAQLGINSICFLLLVPSSFWTVGLHSLVNVCVCVCVCVCGGGPTLCLMLNYEIMLPLRI